MQSEKRPASVQAAFEVFAGKPDTGPHASAMFAYIEKLEAALSAAEPAGEPLELPYKNWRGEISTRKIQPIRIEFGATEWHLEPQWLLVARDIEKNAERSFALRDFNPPQSIAPSVEALDWSGFKGVRINDQWMPDDQELIYTALGVYDGDGDMDDDAREQIIERLLSAWQRSALSAQVQDVAERPSAADQIIGQIEEHFPNWRSYRDLIDCIVCTLHDLRAAAPAKQEGGE